MENIEFSIGQLKATTYVKGNTPIKEGKEVTSFSYGKQPLYILHNDEVPLFFAYEDKLGAAKLGLKETVDKLLLEQMSSLIKKEDMDPAKLVCYIAPCISFAHVEVKRELQERLIDEGYQLACKRTSGVDYLDIALMNVLMLRKLGVLMENIYVSDYGTADDKELLYSKSLGDEKENLTQARLG